MRFLIPTALLALALTACGGGDDGDDAARKSSPQSEAAVEARFNEYADAYFTGDGGAAYEILSERCREKYALSEFAATSEAATETYGALEPKVDSVTIDGDRARVESTFGVPALDEGLDAQTEPQWLYENGDWFSDRCE